MNLRDLSYLVAVAEFEHFGNAADACFVSQPTLSTQIKKLEEELGVTLIERTNKQVMLTDIGRQIVAKAQHILFSVDEMRELALQHKDPEAGTLRLGVIATLAPYLLPRVMTAIQERFPKLKILLYELQTPQIIEKLPAGKLDAALLALPVDHPALESTVLFEEPFFAAIPADHKLAKHKQLELKDLIGSEVLLLEDGHCLRNQALDLCRKVGAEEADGFRATSMETLRQMVASGTGITIVPALAIEHGGRSSNTIRYIPFVEPRPSRTIVISIRRSGYRQQLSLTLGKIISDNINAALANI
ncbi:MAG: LysR family transcriptional regulator [Gammaproteobacteria bacterium]|nr:LysR family transcriptional regulator [Gammaproteobacteria bacterium]